MPDEEEEEIQMFRLELDKFGQSNKRRFYIIEDLSLSCDMCKTPEAKQSISQMTRAYFDELKREEASMNASIDRAMKSAAKKRGKNGSVDAKAMEKKAKKIFDKFTALHLGGTKKLTLKFKGFKKPPFLVFEGKF
ncbi:MAG: hypothetical protein CML02_00675 [Pseudooceanicola sp.]|jgi:hypothetical protein|nr:hypothetical protein [Pseudooceanicola sp.]|tara:strand:+ start:1397 stop:1801 length:405 start_codon:yes stop_codon:yes gene_type:complete